MDISKKIVSWSQSDWKSEGCASTDFCFFAWEYCFELPAVEFLQWRGHWNTGLVSQCALFNALSFVVLHSKTLRTIAIILIHNIIKHSNLSLLGIPWVFKLTCLFYSFPKSDFRFWPKICFGFRKSSQEHDRTNEKFQNQWLGILEIFLQVCPVSPLYLLIFYIFFVFRYDTVMEWIWLEGYQKDHLVPPSLPWAGIPISVANIYFVSPSQLTNSTCSSVLHIHQQ